jgi:hypothetical protein
LRSAGLLARLELRQQHRLRLSRALTRRAPARDATLIVGCATAYGAPMDGQTLELWDDGRCMHSTNVPIP